MKIIAFNGSPRENGNTAFLLKTALAELEKEGIKSELVHVPANLRGCTACYKCSASKDKRCAMPDDGLNDFVAKMDAADGIIFGSPTYFADCTPQIKALIDRSGFVSRANGGLFRRKIGAGVVAVRRAGAMHALDSLNHFFTIGEMIIVGSSYWNIGFGMGPEDVKNDAEGMKTMVTLGQNMAWVLKKLAAK